MLSATIDTAVFAPPPFGATAEDVYSFVTALQEWRDAMTDGSADVYTSIRAAQVLGDSDLYPIRPRLKQLLMDTDVFEYDANTIAVLAETILNRSAKIEDILGINDILVDDLHLQPDCFAFHTPVALCDEAQRCAVIISLATQYRDETLTGCHALAIREIETGTMIQVRGSILEIACSRDDFAELPIAPKSFEGSTLVCSTFHQLVMTVDEMRILRCARTPAQLSTAIRVGIYRKLAEGGNTPAWNALPQFEIGSQFVASLAAHHVASDSGLADRVLRAIVMTIAHGNLAATHALRTGRGGNDPQKMRGKDAAWRRDVDYEYHLHYWECANGQVELASLVVHNETSIPG